MTYESLRTFIAYWDNEEPMFPPLLEQLFKAINNLAERQYVQRTRLKIAAATRTRLCESTVLQRDLESIRDPGDLEASIKSERIQYLLSLGPKKVTRRARQELSLIHI